MDGGVIKVMLNGSILKVTETTASSMIENTVQHRVLEELGPKYRGFSSSSVHQLLWEIQFSISDYSYLCFDLLYVAN